MIEVRESMAHLFGLGLYQDVQVDASLRGDGVVLTYNLVPAYRVRRIVFEGAPGLPESELRRIVVERHGASPSLARVGSGQSRPSRRCIAIAAIRRPRSPSAPTRTRIRRTLRWSSRFGRALARASATIEVQGSPREPAPQLLSALDVRAGDEYDGVALDERLLRYADELRAQGYYEARVVPASAICRRRRRREPGAEHRAGAARRDRVSRAIRSRRSDRERLVPIAREHSVDEDLLEDSKFGIERHFRERGYCNPRADYQRGDAGWREGRCCASTFTIARGPQCMVEQAEVTGNASIPSAELAPLVVTRAGQPFNESTVGADVAADPELVPAARILGRESDVAGRATRAASRQRVRARQARDCRGRAVGHRLGVFSGQHGHRRRDAARARSPPPPGQPYFEPQIAADADSSRCCI